MQIIQLKMMKTNNKDSIKDATDNLTKVFYELSEKLYSQTQTAAGAADAAGTTTDENGNVYNADYKVEEEGSDDNK